MRRIFSLVSIIGLGLGGGTDFAVAQQFPRIPVTVFNRGPEVHLQPSYGPIGTRVAVVGLGFRPGTRVDIAVGPPNSEFGGSIAHATVMSRGQFRTMLTVTRTFGKPIQPLILGATSGNRYHATTAFIVTF